MPEVASLPANATPTSWLYQPFASGAREGDAVTVGGVASYFREIDIGAEMFPALSVHVPEIVPEDESGPPYVELVHDAIPEVGSLPEAVTPTGWLYQPFASGVRAGAIPETTGGVVSRLIEPVSGALPTVLPFPSWSVTTQEYAWPAVSDVRAKPLHPVSP